MDDFHSQEAIVVLSEHGVTETRSRIERETEILQSISPRVFLVKLAPKLLDRLSKMEHVVASTTSALPPAAMRGLTEPERQWASAWNLRGTKKSRPGEGLNWDAPGFSPPDRPR